jgi:hypothetical protein
MLVKSCVTATFDVQCRVTAGVDRIHVSAERRRDLHAREAVLVRAAVLVRVEHLDASRLSPFRHDSLLVCPPQSNLQATDLLAGASDGKPGVIRAAHKDADSVHVAGDTLGQNNR